MDHRGALFVATIVMAVVLAGCPKPAEEPGHASGAPASPASAKAEGASAGKSAAADAPKVDVFRGRKELPPGFPSDLLILPGATPYDTLSAQTQDGRTAFSVRYTIKQQLLDVRDAYTKRLAAAKLGVKVETTGPRVNLEFKQGEQLQGRIYILPTSAIDEADVQVLAVK